MNKEEIRSVLAPMLRGTSIWISGTKVYFTTEGMFAVPVKHSAIPSETPSLREAVEDVYRYIS